MSVLQEICNRHSQIVKEFYFNMTTNKRKLTQKQVEEIRLRYKEPIMTQRRLSELYQVSQTTINRIISGKKYAK